MKKTLAVILALTLATSMLAGCQGSNSSSQAPSGTSSSGTGTPTAGGGTLNLVFSEDIDTLNPHMERSSTDAEVIWSVGGVLYRIAPGVDTPYQIVPEYADGKPQKLDADGKQWKIKVRDDAKWADGTPLTAEDFVYSIKMLYDPLLLNAPGTTLDESGVYIVNSTEYLKQIADKKTVAWEDVGIKATEGNFIELSLEKAADAAQVELAFSSCISVPVKKELYESGMTTDKTETTYGSTWEKFASSGPFKVTGWTKDAEIKMERNPNYPIQEGVSLDSIVYKIVPEAGTRLQLFEAGQLDSTALKEADLEKYGEDPRILEVPGGGVLCIGLGMINEKNPILQNKNFRQALFFGTNRSEAAKLGNNIAADYYITQPYIVDINTGLAFRDTPEAKSYIDATSFSYNPEKAKQLLAAALKETGSTKATIEILYQDSSESRKMISEYLQNSWQNLFGTDLLEVKLQAVPSQQLSERYRSHTSNPNAFEAGVIQSTYNYLDPNSALIEWGKDASRKKIPYYSDAFTAVYDQIVALPMEDVKGRTAKIAEAEKIMLDDAPFIPVVQTVESVLVSPRVTLPYTTYNSVLRYAWIWAKIS